MKRPLVPVACGILLFAAIGLVACRPPRDRGDWRAPVTAKPCKADTDCPNGTMCAIELGASQGTCGDADGGYPYGPRSPDDQGGPDGGGGPFPPHQRRAPGQSPPFNVQPQPGDINI